MNGRVLAINRDGEIAGGWGGGGGGGGDGAEAPPTLETRGAQLGFHLGGEGGTNLEAGCPPLRIYLQTIIIIIRNTCAYHRVGRLYK